MLFLHRMPIRFRRFELDPETYHLSRDGRPVALRPKAFDLLAHLVAHRHRVVSREELVRVVWGHTNVGPGSLSGLVNELRTALEEPAGEAGSIRTVHARGYQFVAPVEDTGALRDRAGARPALRKALSDTLRRHGVTEGKRVAPLLDRLCEEASGPARAPMRRVESARAMDAARADEHDAAGRSDNVSR
ncbi:MAG: winged helix-turn-helix domain-containing protein [bacterium]|nr:winged helix-turn-helix domain-containing protein [bacterium]